MALDLTKLERVGGGARKLFIYDAGADTIATVTASGYFNNARDQLDKADVIIVVGNTQASVDTIFVSSLRSAHGSTGSASAVTTISVEGVTAT
jgi:hypothetical protein